MCAKRNQDDETRQTERTGVPPNESRADFGPMAREAVVRFQDFWSGDLLTETAGERDSSSRLEPGSKWGGLRIINEVARGGFGIVYRAVEEGLDRVVALKILDPDLPDTAAAYALKEARLLARLDAPGIVQVYGQGQHDGLYGFWMPFLTGTTLEDHVRGRGALSASVSAEIINELCESLEAIHRDGVVHRDLKPSNVMLQERGGRLRPLLFDFGIALSRVQGTGRTRAGTDGYMAPEQRRGDRTDHQADVYALGRVLSFCLTGCQPRLQPAEAVDEPLAGGHDGTPTLRLLEVARRASADDPRDRHGSVTELRRDVLAAVRPRRLPRWPMVVAASAVLVATLFYGLDRWSFSPSQLTSDESNPSGPQAFVVSDTGDLVATGAGDTLVSGTEVAFALRCSSPTFVYVFTENQRGRLQALFPLPDQGDHRAPIVPSERTVIPPGLPEAEIDTTTVLKSGWTVTTDSLEVVRFLLIRAPRAQESLEDLLRDRRPYPFLDSDPLAWVDETGELTRGVAGETPVSVSELDSLRLRLRHGPEVSVAGFEVVVRRPDRRR